MSNPEKRPSAALTDGVDAVARARELKGVGFTEADLAPRRDRRR